MTTPSSPMGSDSAAKWSAGSACRPARCGPRSPCNRPIPRAISVHLPAAASRAHPAAAHGPVVRARPSPTGRRAPTARRAAPVRCRVRPVIRTWPLTVTDCRLAPRPTVRLNVVVSAGTDVSSDTSCGSGVAARPSSGQRPTQYVVCHRSSQRQARDVSCVRRVGACVGLARTRGRQRVGAGRGRDSGRQLLLVQHGRAEARPP